MSSGKTINADDLEKPIDFSSIDEQFEQKLKKVENPPKEKVYAFGIQEESDDEDDEEDDDAWDMPDENEDAD